MQTLDAGKDGRSDARAEAGGVPAAASLVVPAAAEHLREALAGEQQGGGIARRVVVLFPLETVSTLNEREHWAAKAKRAKKQRGETYLQLRCAALGFQVPCTVTITRIAPRALDGDNAQGSLKSVRDGVADWLKVDDGDARVTWAYAQRKGKPKEYAVEIEVV